MPRAILSLCASPLFVFVSVFAGAVDGELNESPIRDIYMNRTASHSDLVGALALAVCGVCVVDITGVVDEEALNGSLETKNAVDPTFACILTSSSSLHWLSLSVMSDSLMMSSHN
jgi:hypothetical protein